MMLSMPIFVYIMLMLMMLIETQSIPEVSLPGGALFLSLQ
jgi:hypothetical protein